MIIKANKPIFICFDFSKQAYIAIKQSIELAKALHATIEIIQVAKSDAELRIKDLEELAQTSTDSHQIECKYKTYTGEIFSVLTKILEDAKPALLVFPVHEETPFKSGLFSGTPTLPKFLSKLDVPVMTVRGTHSNPDIKSVIFPFDLSYDSSEKVGASIQLAKLFQADIKIVSIFKPNDEDYENRLFPYIKQIKKMIKDMGISCSNRSLPSKTPAEAIVEYTHQNQGDIIMVMNQKDLSFSEKMNGGMIHRIVQLSNVPVILLNPMKRNTNSGGGGGSGGM